MKEATSAWESKREADEEQEKKLYKDEASAKKI